MTPDLTVVYYTSNREHPVFEDNIRKALLESIGSIPLISVSQEPIDLGHNICIGRQVPCSVNAFRQFQIGAAAAKTRYVCAAEADFLYPPEHFQFIPREDDVVYVSSNLYMLSCMHKRSRSFVPKRPTEGAIMSNRDHLIKLIDRQLSGVGLWSYKPDVGGDYALPHIFSLGKVEVFTTPVPLVTFKTDNNIHRKAPIMRGRWIQELAPWGNAHELIDRYGGRL